MAKKEFKAESKRLLELMIHSIYTNKEIFLRELISNASDATDKRYYQSIQAGAEALNRDELPIEVVIDKDARTLTISDNGCGMTMEDLENNLGVIAQSGSLDFKANIEDSEDIDIIGQFGVGFYSAFMVSDHVEVTTKAMGSDQGYRWISSGVDGYTIEPVDKQDIGSSVKLTIKPDTENDKYDDFLESHFVKNLIKKYSDYIRYPIRMEMEKFREKEGTEEGKTETESYTEQETLNSMTPIWKKRRGEVTDEEYNGFYKDKFYDYQDPVKIIYTSTEGVATYNALLFIPSHLPMNYHSKEYQKGLQLYASGVLIMEHCADLLPDYFGFVRGVVDSQDLSLNISRELLQQDSQLKFIAGRIEKKIQSELLAMQNSDREKYTEVFKNFGVSIKYGIYESYGMNKDSLQDLIMFQSSKGEMVTLKEYLDRMLPDQKYIYYASGDNITQLKNLPASESVLEKGFELLYFTDQIDEFVIRVLHSYSDKEFRSIAGGDDLGLESEDEKKELEQQSKNSKELLEFMNESLGDKITEVKISNRLKKHPVCLTTKGDITLEMEKVLGNMPGNQPIKAERVLELNPDHDIFKTLEGLFESDKDKLKAYTEILYNQSLLLEGLSIEDPVAYTTAISQLMI